MTKEHKKNNSTYNIAMCGVLTALAMIFSYIESIIPVPIPVPGIKLGVANIAVITILYTLGIKEAVIINILRISLTAMLFGNLNSFLFKSQQLLFKNFLIKKQVCFLFRSSDFIKIPQDFSSVNKYFYFFLRCFFLLGTDNNIAIIKQFCNYFLQFF